MEKEAIWKVGWKNDVRDVANRTKPVMAGHRPSKNRVLTAGLLYLGVIVFGIYAQITRMGLIVSGDAAATVDNIIASGGALQAAFASDILSHICFILLGLTCYQIFKNIDYKAALVMLLFVTISGMFAFVNTANVLDAIQIVSGSGPLTASDANMVLTHLNVHADGGYLAQILGWGPWLVPLGYLGYKSGFVPKAIGIILMVGGVGLTAQGFQYFLLPGMGDLFALGSVVSTVGEFSICGWFLYRGTRGFAGAPKKEMDSRDSRTSS